MITSDKHSHFTDNDIIDLAKGIAGTCQLIVNLSNQSPIKQLANYAESKGIDLPQNESITEEGIIARLIDECWWRRQLRTFHGRKAEQYEIEQGRVHRKTGIYVSDHGLQSVKQQKYRNRRLLESLIATNEEDKEYTLQELADLSVSNPKNRRNL